MKASAATSSEGLVELQTVIGHFFSDPELFISALTHKSCEDPALGIERNNERLETLGDAVLELAVTRYMFHLPGMFGEGMITRARAFAVNREALAEAARTTGLDGLIRLGQTEVETGGAKKTRLLADTFEALVGAVFLDGGFDAAERMVLKLLKKRLDTALATEDGFPGDHKTRLQEYSQKNRLPLPEYFLIDTEGPDHHKTFSVSVRLGGREAKGSGPSKQAAEKAAAGALLDHMAGIGLSIASGGGNGI